MAGQIFSAARRWQEGTSLSLQQFYVAMVFIINKICKYPHIFEINTKKHNILYTVSLFLPSSSLCHHITPRKTNGLPFLLITCPTAYKSNTKGEGKEQGAWLPTPCSDTLCYLQPSCFQQCPGTQITFSPGCIFLGDTSGLTQ